MTSTRQLELEKRLRDSFAIESLEIIDESHLHAGHAGARDGRSHFRVRIHAAEFAGLAPLKCHKLIYAAVGTMMETDIHAGHSEFTKSPLSVA